MDNEFPTSDEEFDLMHQDEYDALRDLDSATGKEKVLRNHEKSSQNKDPILEDVSTAPKKRTYEELFGDISDLETNDFSEIEKQKKKRPRWNEPEEVIKTILAARAKVHDLELQNAHTQYSNKKTDGISLKIPSWNFVAVTRTFDYERVYIRVKSNRIQTESNVQRISNLLSVPYNQLKEEAESIISRNAVRESHDVSAVENMSRIDDNLWVDKYRPQTYMELLSDESVNRHFLHWLKLWDKIVFKKDVIHRKRKVQSPVSNRKYIKNEKPLEEVDSKGFPVHRIALLCGPPGLGKTTLAHLVAKHAGYNVVEVNASDERGPEAFRQILLSSTQMQAVIGDDPRPNCLILDEIDGAPAASIEVLLKFVQGKLLPKGKKNKRKAETESDGCQRPVICVCNELYTPSLRALRATALIIRVPEVSPSRLAERLIQIAQKENLVINPHAALQLAEKSGCDVRSCLGALQYMGGTDLQNNISLGWKDSRKGLFDIWKTIMSVPMTRNGRLPIPERISRILKTVQNGDTDKLAQGIFHNYPEICNEKLEHIVASLDWFRFYDEIVSYTKKTQIWSVMSYVNFAFVTWHLYLSKLQSPKITYPFAVSEANQKLAKSIATVTAVHRSSGCDSIALITDFATFIPDLLSPRIRTVSGQLFSSKEKSDLTQVVSIMLDFGLTLIQERNASGIYEYKLDPNIVDIGLFPTCKTRRTLPYAVKQIIIQELEAERLRRLESTVTRNASTELNTDVNLNTPSSSSLKLASKTDSTTLQKPRKNIHELNTEILKDFFGRPLPPEKQKSAEKSKRKSDIATAGYNPILLKNGIVFQFNFGVTDGIFRDIYMKDFL